MDADSGSTSNSLDIGVGPDMSRDEELIRQFQLGNADALTLVFRRYHRLVYAIAWRILHDHCEAEDVMQSIFLELLQKAAQFDPTRGTLSIWILQFAYHRSISRKNYLTLRQFYNEPKDEKVGLGGWDTVAVPPAQYCSQLAKEALSVLEPHQRQVVELLFFGGLTLREIAEQTKQTYVSVRHLYYRALKRMRVYLSGAAPVSESEPDLSNFESLSRVNA